MKASLELTLYPLQDNYLPDITAFIAHLNSYSDLSLQTFPTATVICGDYDTVMDCLKAAVRWNTEQQGKAVFVAKILPNYEAL